MTLEPKGSTHLSTHRDLFLFKTHWDIKAPLWGVRNYTGAMEKVSHLGTEAEN